MLLNKGRPTWRIYLDSYAFTCLTWLGYLSFLESGVTFWVWTKDREDWVIGVLFQKFWVLLKLWDWRLSLREVMGRGFSSDFCVWGGALKKEEPFSYFSGLGVTQVNFSAISNRPWSSFLCKDCSSIYYFHKLSNPSSPCPWVVIFKIDDS